MIKYTLVFLAMFCLDFSFALYTRRVSEGYALKAATWAACILLLKGYVITSYVNDSINLIPAAFGAFFGAMSAVKLDMRNK